MARISGWESCCGCIGIRGVCRQCGPCVRMSDAGKICDLGTSDQCNLGLCVTSWMKPVREGYILECCT